MFVLKVDVYFVFKRQTGIRKIQDTCPHIITVCFVLVRRLFLLHFSSDLYVNTTYYIQDLSDFDDYDHEISLTCPIFPFNVRILQHPSILDVWTL